MQVNSIQNTPSFGIKVPKNLAKSIQQQAQGTLIGDNAEAIVKNLKQIGSDVTELTKFSVEIMPGKSKDGQSPLFISMLLKTGVPSSKKEAIHKLIGYMHFSPSSVDVVNSDITFAVNNAEELYISKKMLGDIGKRFNLSGLNDSAKQLSCYFGKTHESFIQFFRKEVSKCFTKK